MMFVVSILWCMVKFNYLSCCGCLLDLSQTKVKKSTRGFTGISIINKKTNTSVAMFILWKIVEI